MLSCSGSAPAGVLVSPANSASKWTTSASGAEQARAAIGAKSLKARVAGIGPIVTFRGGELFGGDVSLKMKYVSEFNAKRRFESDVVPVNLTIAY